jgi:hypothetical protein
VPTSDRTSEPEYLYKYCGTHRSDFPSPVETLLTQGRMFFPSPADFNDPFDCRFRMTFRASPLKRQRYARELVREKAPHDMPRHVRKEIARQGSNSEAYHRAADRFVDRINRTVGVLCLSAQRDNIVMWSHYAERHKGICLEFRRAGDLSYALAVNYSDEYPVINFFQIETKFRVGGDDAARAAQKEFVDLIYLTKAKEWKYEDEWRLVDPLRGRGLHDLAPGLLSGVIFGCRSTEEDRRKVRGWLQKASASVNLYQARENGSAFRLDISAL